MEENDPVKVANEFVQNKRDDEENRKLVVELSHAMGISQLQEDLDVIKKSVDLINQNVNALNDSVVKIVGVVDQHTNMLNHGTPQIQQTQGYSQNEQKIKDLAEVAKTLAEVWKSFKGDSTNVQIPGLEPETILREAGEMARENLNVSRSINQAILRSLKGKAVNKLASAIADGPIELHGPE